ncbi:MAG: undecaprenyl-phosphate glucose phosphotransferase [Planctomycetales bacterium]|nr:undecaprenyl-phosphate glucose phosphotransferase [Planctomycetales bacterium]
MALQTRQAYALLLVAGDALATAAAWIAAYGLRMTGFPVPVDKGVPPFGEYLLVVPLAVGVSLLAFRSANLYRPRPDSGALRDATRVVRATLLAAVLLVAAMFFLSRFEYSRGVVAYFVLLHPGAVLLGRAGARRAVGALRARGILAARRALVLGAGRRGQDIVDSLRRRSALGVEPIGYCDDRASRASRSPRGLPVLGPVADAPAVIAREKVDEVYVTIPLRDWPAIEQALERLSEEVVDVRLVADVGGGATLRASSGDLDGLPIVSLRDTPLARGWNRAAKRALDFAGSAALLVVLSPLLLAVAIAVKLGSKGPLFYRQERMGLDGRVFSMAKFRSMRADAEKETGAVWARKDDPRRTRLGAFLRKANLDELPQLWNVLVGHMSLVGPRPERPVFIEQFRKTIPRYMLRHKVKAGITGWAQVNGWRGNTSLRKRIQYDLWYIENWSLGLDLKVLVLTLLRGFGSPNAY